MTPWYLRTTDSKLSLSATAALLQRGLLCRSLFNINGHRIQNVQHVDFGDVINVYHRDKQRHALGAVRVIQKQGHALAPHLWLQVAGSSLYTIDPSVVRAIDTNGAYQNDPIIGALTVWLVEPVGAAAPFNPSLFGQRQALAH